ncbi:interleukin-3 receptor subunit alpha isoform X3 [Mus caroli]|uniref:Interleukin-3 receptor subunit alpha isoform X3 n=1 Tax=Mus caroli TaxID=10089 RepID=A0A6P7QHG2_MUSCR|nr:interleukin-3 receptor subunit alpha isoform X3 [Mus caroli]
MGVNQSLSPAYFLFHPLTSCHGDWCQSKPRHCPQLWMSPVTQAPPRLPLTTAAVPEAPPTAVTTPIRNLRIDPAHHMLIWDPVPGADITTGAYCRKGRDNFVWADPGLARCSFQSLSLCHVTNFTVFLGKDSAVAGSIRFPPDDGGNHEAAAQDLRCWVYEGQLSCRWGRGPKAAGDVHYRMFWRDVRLGPAHDRECPHYHSHDVNTTGPAPHGSHEGCTLDLDPVLGSAPNGPKEDLVPQFTITINGSSPAGPVPCMDDTVDLQRAEVLAPPTLTVECIGSEAHARWDAQTRFHYGHLRFTLQSSSSEPQEYNVSVPHFWVPNAGAISFRVRSRSEVDPQKLSSWSKAWGLGGLGAQFPYTMSSIDQSPAQVCPPEVTPVKTALVTSVATVLGAGLLAAGLLLWWRKSLLSRLCPPIPRLRLPLAGEMVAWEPGPEDCEVTPVTDA